MIADDLLDIARRLAEGNPTQTDLRRAVSSVYYALFHALCQSNADTLVGDDPQSRDQLAWRQAYRALDHGYARQRCILAGRNPRFMPTIQALSNHFVATQISRHQADYEPDTDFEQQEIAAIITQIDAAIAAFRGVPAPDRRAFAVYVLMRERQN